MKEFWNERFKSETYAYGKQPNHFLKEQLVLLKPGKILLPMEGEGRNAVFCAQQGWKVDAFDFSVSGQTKALQLAKQHQVKIDYSISSLQDFNYPKNRYEAVALIFAHPPEVDRIFFHQQVAKSLKPGGYLILEAFHLAQLHQNRNSGGPKKEAMLYTEKMLQEDFSLLKIQHLKHETRILNEGDFHQGKAEVIQLIAQKK